MSRNGANYTRVDFNKRPPLTSTSIVSRNTDNERQKVSHKCCSSSNDKQLHLPEAKNNAHLYHDVIAGNI